MPTYRNTRTGHEYTSDKPSKRLDSLDVWERVTGKADQEPAQAASAPASPALAPESTKPAAKPAAAKKAPARKTAARKA